MTLAIDFAARAVTTALGRPIAPPTMRAHCEWREADTAPLPLAAGEAVSHGSLLGTIREQGAKYPHSRGRAFSDHLEGVSALLAHWQAPSLLVEGGLCHSIYSTQQFPYGLFDYSQRDQVRERLGSELERLVFLFCSHDRVDLYAQAIDLARAGRVLPASGLRLRNALTGAYDQIPRSMVAALLLIHAADIVEQMDGFDYEFTFAVLHVVQPCLAVPACYAQMRDGGVVPEGLKIRINPSRGTFGLYPILGLRPHLLDMRVRLTSALRGQADLSRRQTRTLANLARRHPYLFDLAWLLARRGQFESREDAVRMEARAQELLRAWGAPWLKTPFDGDTTYLTLYREQRTAG